MKKPIQITRQETIKELQSAVKGVKDEQQKVRIRAIISIKRGVDRKDIASDNGITDRTIYNWVQIYNEGGIEGLQMGKGGRPEGNPKWDQNIFDALIKEIESKSGYWSIPKMQVWIEEKYKEKIPDTTIWYHLKQKKYSYKSGRPHPYKGDRKEQKVFKKRG